MIVLGCRSTKEEDTDGGVVENTERKGMISRSEMVFVDSTWYNQSVL